MKRAVWVLIFALMATGIPTAEAAHVTAVDALNLLTVKGRAPKTGYSRDLFNPNKDVDKNGCDTRNDILARDLVNVRRSGDGCTVEEGKLADPYSGKSILFVRKVNPHSVEIDHVVSLSDAWQKGAFRWDARTREKFANDPLELLAVDGKLNNKKSNSDAASWLPPNKAYRCTFVSLQIAIKYEYKIWVTQAEKDAMLRVLNTCPGQRLPT